MCNDASGVMSTSVSPSPTALASNKNFLQRIQTALNSRDTLGPENPDVESAQLSEMVREEGAVGQDPEGKRKDGLFRHLPGACPEP